MMNRMLGFKSVTFMAAAIAAVSSFAEIIHHDDKDFYVDEQGVEHQLFYEKGNAEKIWGLSTYADQAFQIPAALTADGILVTLPTEAYSGSWPFGFTCYGMNFRKGVSSNCTWEKAHYIGAYGIRADVSGWTLKFYHTFNLTASQTWRGPEATELSTSPFIIKTTHDTYPTAYPGGVLAESDGLSLTLAGDLRLILRDETTDLSTTDVIVQKPAVLSLVSLSPGKGRLHAHKLTLDGGNGFYFGATSKTDYYGSIAELSVERVAPTVELKNGAALTAYGTTSVSVTGGVTVVAAEGSTGSVVGTYVLKDDETVFKAEADATLDLTGATLSGGAMSVQGPGTVAFDFDKNMTAGGVSFSGCALVLSGSAGALMDSLADLSAIEIAASGVVEIGDAAMATYRGTDIEVSSGTLFVPSASSIPAGVRIVTSGTGALCLRDATGFDKTTQMGGTQALLDGSSGLVITDVPRVDETIVVGAGETLSVMGSGLAATSIVDLRQDARIAFYETATVAASFVATNGAVDVVTMSSAVTSTVSGVINSQGGTFRIASPGLVRFLGGGKMGAFKMLSGEAEVGGANYLGYGTISMVSGHLLVTSQWKFDTGWINVNLNQTQTGDVTLEIGPGGDLYLAKGNCYVFIGKDPNWKTRLYINGGVFGCDVSERFCLNCSVDNNKVKTDYASNGIIEIDNGGEFANVMLIRSSATSGPNAGVILGDGTWSSRRAWAYRFGYGVFLNEGDCPVTVRGHITFDMSNFISSVVTNQSASATGVWTCEKDGRVSVTGGRTLVFRDVPEMALDLTRTPVGNVVFCNSAAEEEEVSPTAVTWTLPKTGAKTGTVTATGEGGKTGPLVASYVVPEGVTFDGSQTNGWYEGFTSQTLSNLVFGAGSAYRFAPFAADFAPLALAGTLTLPETMDCYLTADGSRRDFRSEPVIVPALGVEGDCTWTCRGDTAAHPKDAALSVADDQLVLDYTLPGALLLVR